MLSLNKAIFLILMSLTNFFVNITHFFKIPVTCSFIFYAAFLCRGHVTENWKLLKLDTNCGCSLCDLFKAKVERQKDANCLLLLAFLTVGFVRECELPIFAFSATFSPKNAILVNTLLFKGLLIFPPGLPSKVKLSFHSSFTINH